SGGGRRGVKEHAAQETAERAAYERSAFDLRDNRDATGHEVDPPTSSVTRRGKHSARITRTPPSRLDRRDEVISDAVELVGLFQIYGMAGPRNNGKSRSRHPLAVRGSTLLVGVKDVILWLHFDMTDVPARGCAAFIRRVSGRCRIIVKLSVPPSAALRKSLAVLLHEEKVSQRIRHVYDKRGFRALLRFPLDLGDPGALGERLAITRNAGLVGCNDR